MGLKLHTQAFFAWEYEKALVWMNQKRDSVLSCGEMYIAYGDHSSVIVTLGQNAAGHRGIDYESLFDNGIKCFQVERGGGATLHGPGQLVVYPVIDLKRFDLSIPDLTALFENSIIEVLEHFGIEAKSGTLGPGVYVQNK